MYNINSNTIDYRPRKDKIISKIEYDNAQKIVRNDPKKFESEL